MSRPRLNVNNKHIRNFSMEHYVHRYFNEVPKIDRHVEEINRKNSAVTQLLGDKEPFTKASDDKHVTFLFNRACDKSVKKERFTVKKKITFGDIIDSILTFILVVVFILFMGKLAYICFFEDREDGLNI